MKRIVVFLILICSAFGLTFAQISNRSTWQVQQSVQRPAPLPRVPPALPQNPQPSYRYDESLQPQQQNSAYSTSGPSRRLISGVLGIGRGMITLTDAKGVAWYVLGLDRYVGFIDGLDLGEKVILEGYAPAAPGSSQERFFQAVKLILDGMDYDLAVNYEPAPPPQDKQVMVRSNRESVSGDSRVMAPSRKEPAPQPKNWEHKHTSQWAPNSESNWMMNLDLNAIWREDSTFWQHNSQDNGFFD